MSRALPQEVSGGCEVGLRPGEGRGIAGQVDGSLEEAHGLRHPALPQRDDPQPFRILARIGAQPCGLQKLLLRGPPLAVVGQHRAEIEGIAGPVWG